MAKQPRFWDFEERLKEISADGDPLETLAGAVDFERFRPILERSAGKPPGPKGGRLALDVVPEFIQDARAAEPPRAVARRDRGDGARPAGLDALLRP